MSRAIPRDIPGPDWRVRPEDLGETSWREIFAPAPGAPLRLSVDIGVGRGEFVTDLARRDPDAAFVGVEVSWKRVLKLARRLAKTEITNIRLLCAPAEWAVREAFGKDAIETAWINFPDPWPKRRHRHRRLVDAELIAQLTSRIAPGGSIHVATDDESYAEAVDAVLSAASGLENAHAPRAWRPERPETIETAYEKEWRAEGRRCFFFHYRRGEPALGGPA